MAITIIDNFKVNAAAPIDNRLVVGPFTAQQQHLGYQTKDLIPTEFRYPGLRIWDLNDSKPYVWNGVSWQSESATGVTALTVSEEGYIPRFTNSTTLTNSIIYNRSNGNIGIGLTGTNISPGGINGLHVKGNIKTDDNVSGFIGRGSLITHLKLDTTTSGILNLDRIDKAPVLGTYLLTGISTNTTWTNVSDVTVGTSLRSNKLLLVNDTTNTNQHFISFSPNDGYQDVKVDKNKLKYVPSKGQILLSGSSDSNNPLYSFDTAVNTGMYHVSGSLNLTYNGTDRLRIDTSGIKTTDGSATLPSISFIGDTNTGIYRIGEDSIGITTNGINKITISNNSTSISTSTGQRILADTEVTTFGIFNTNQNAILGSSLNDKLTLRTMTTPGGSSNIVTTKDYALRGAVGGDWTTWRSHNAITIDGVFDTPGGPANTATPAGGTLTFWERAPFLREQYIGSENKKTLTINSDSSPFVRVDGTLLVGTNSVTPSVLADFTSTTRGVTLPRMTTTQRDAITSPANGLTVFNTSRKTIDVYNTATTVTLPLGGTANINPRWTGMVPFLYRGTVVLGDTPNGADQLITIYLTPSGPVKWTTGQTIPTGLVDITTSNYMVVGSVVSVSGNYNVDNDVIWVIKDKTNNSFKMGFREVGSSVQNINFDFYILPLA